MRLRYLLVAAVLVATPAVAQDTGWEHGHKLVLINCARCHAIGLSGDSPLPPAPPFREVARNYSTEELVDGFLEGLAVRHQAMPEWQMSEPQAEDIAAFVLSLDPGVALAPASPAAEGFALLHESCARCHAAGLRGASPLAQAPPFREVVKRYAPAQLEEALAEGIVTGHNDMPEFEFTPDDIGKIVTYLEALRRG